MNNTQGWMALLWLVAAALLGGCASSEAFHTRAWSAGNCTQDQSEWCSQSYYQEYADYDVAFAEYTERGNAFNDAWITDVLENIRQHSENTGVVVVTFIHGWRHNAEEGDSNLVEFKKALQTVASSPDSVLGGRRLIGLYVGWRGISIDLPLLDLVTFWDRKAVAEVVGTGAVTRLLLALQRIDQQRPDNVLAVVGHSFGGGIVVSALSEVMTAQIIGRENNGDNGHAPAPVTEMGDAVIVLNPALEANRMLNLVEAAVSHRYSSRQSPLFVSLSTDADFPSHYLFPLGQTVGLSFWKQTDLQRGYYQDRLTRKPLTLKEEHLDATTLGNFAPYLTHSLVAQGSETRPVLALQTCDANPEACVPRGLTTLSGHPTISPKPPHYPLFFIKTDASVMEGHNDIFNPKIKSLILALLDDAIRHSVSREFEAGAPANPREITPPSILYDAERLNQRFSEFYRKEK